MKKTSLFIIVLMILMVVTLIAGCSNSKTNGSDNQQSEISSEGTIDDASDAIEPETLVITDEFEVFTEENQAVGGFE